METNKQEMSFTDLMLNYAGDMLQDPDDYEYQTERFTALNDMDIVSTSLDDAITLEKGLGLELSEYQQYLIQNAIECSASSATKRGFRMGFSEGYKQGMKTIIEVLMHNPDPNKIAHM